MELKEAYEYIKITDEEKKSIQRYMGFGNARINMLANFDPYVQKELESDSWELAKDTEDLEQDIKDFLNVYSAMYKEKRNIVNKQLYRGTTSKEVKRLGKGMQYNRILSTSSSRSMAKTFCKPNDPAFVRIKVQKEIPAIYANEYLEANVREENEVILAPFSKIEEAKLASQYNGCQYYDITISKPELKEVSEERMEELREEIFAGFAGFLKNIKNLKDDGTRAIFDKEHIQLYNFKEKINEYMQGLCRQKEIQIDRAQITIKQEQKRIQEQARQIKKKNEETLLKQKQQKIQNTANRGIEGAGELKQLVDKEYGELLKKEKQYVSAALKLGVDFERSVSNAKLGKDVLRMNTKIRKSTN